MLLLLTPPNELLIDGTPVIFGHMEEASYNKLNSQDVCIHCRLVEPQ
jgi:hypothetical protein